MSDLIRDLIATVLYGLVLAVVGFVVISLGA